MNGFMQQLHQVNPLFYYFGWVCLIAGGICLALTRFSRTQVMGTNAWYKPVKFFLSTAIFVWSMGWYGQYVSQQVAVGWYSWGMIVLFGLEDGFIAVQAGRGQLSHFNRSTPFYTGLYGFMAVAAVAISLWTAYIGVLLFNEDLAFLPRAYVWGIRWGMIVFVLFSLEGLVMGARLSHSVGGPDGSAGLPVVNWSKTYGDLRVAHFMGMHALQVLPLLSYYVLKDTWLVVGAGFLYSLLTTILFVQAIRGKPLFR